MKSMIFVLSSALLFPLAGHAKSPLETGQAIPGVDTGYLQVIWSDPIDTRAPASIEVSLVNGEEVIDLDPSQANIAAEDLHGLAGRKVAIYHAHASGNLEALVPVDDLTHSRSISQTATAPDRVDQWLTIGCKFPEWPLTPVSVSFMSSQYGRMRGHIGHFWHKMSYGKLSVHGRAHGWFDLPHTQANYLSGGVLNTTRLAQDCVAQAAAHVDISQVYGINMVFNKALDNISRGGRVCAPLIDRTQPCTPMTWITNSHVRSMRVMLHEMGHAYTLPHSDNSDADEDTYDNAWDIMSRTGWGPSHPVYGTRPIFLMSWHRKRLGWMPENRIATFVGEPRFNTLVYLDSASEDRGTGKHMVILREPPRRDRDGNITQPNMGAHYIIEARLGDIDLDRGLPGQAVIIHRVSHGSSGAAKAVDADNPPANLNNNEGSMFKVGESWRAPEGIGTLRVMARTRDGFLISIGPNR